MSEFINTVDVIGDEALTDSIIDKTITEFNDDVISTIGPSAFQVCPSLRSVNLPNVTSLDNECFDGCSQLTEVSLPNLTTIKGSYAFKGCISLTHIDLPNLTSVGRYDNGVFQNCGSLKSVNLPLLTIVGGGFFSAHFGSPPIISKLDLPCCITIATNAMAIATLETLILRSNTVCTLDNVNSLNNTKIKAGAGYIYVPKALVDSYKSATNWSTYATQFRALEDYTVDGTTTGELDETKI